MRKGSKERAFWNRVAQLPPLAGSVMVGRLLPLWVLAVLMIAPEHQGIVRGTENESDWPSPGPSHCLCSHHPTKGHPFNLSGW